MSLVALEKLGCLNEVKNLLENIGIRSLAFDPYPTYPSLAYEFLSSYGLRTHHVDDQNPLYSMRFKLGGRDRFLTATDFNTLFGFKKGGLL